MAVTPVDSESFHSQPWANGGGTTTELAAGPDRGHWRWRISRADVVTAGPFSSLPGVRRQIAPLDARLRLKFADGRDRTLLRLEVFAFDGGDAPTCELPDGPGRDLNLMLRDGAAGQLIVRPLTGHMLLPPGALRWFVYQISGQARLVQGDTRLDLATGAAAWLIPIVGQRSAIEGGGDIALVRLDAEPALTRQA